MSGKAKVTGNRLALRREMHTNNTPITRLATGTIVDILEKVNATWWRVRYGTQVGYVMAQYVTEIGGPTVPAPDTGEGGADAIEDNQYNVVIQCKDENEANRVLKLLREAIQQ